MVQTFAAAPLTGKSVVALGSAAPPAGGTATDATDAPNFVAALRPLDAVTADLRRRISAAAPPPRRRPLAGVALGFVLRN